MRRIYCHIVLLTTIMLLASGCQVGPGSLSAQQLQEFIREKQIQPLAVEEVGGDVTVILYKDTSEMGCYIAFARNGIEALHLVSELTDLRGDAISPVSFTHKSILKYNVLCLTINDKDVQARAHTIKVIFPDKKETIVPVINGGNMIVYQQTEIGGDDITVIIYDINQSEIIRSPFW